MRLLTQLKIRWLKRRFRVHYCRYATAVDRMSCGIHVAHQFPSVSRHRVKCNEILAKLKEIDPAAKDVQLL